MKIQDATGTGKGAKVDKNNKLTTTAVISEQQHEISHEEQESFQISGTKAITTTEQDILLIKNTSDKALILTFLRLEVASAAVASEDAYFNISVGGDYASGGTAIVPANMFVGSPKSAEGSFYDNSGAAIITSGTFTQIDRTYKDDNSYSKHGSLILPKNACLKVSHKGSTVAGTAYCRVSFYYDEKS